ncbi:MAG: LemA family protein [Xanthomonadales bacterium]|nr:LemA family protein [Xanthomonadales bacterium]
MDFLVAILFPVLVLWGIWTFNRLVRLRNQVNEAWAGIDVQLQRRHALVPNLVAAVKGYQQHESSALQRVTQLRGHPELPLEERAAEESSLSRSIGRLFALAEDYPELKASGNFAQLHDTLVEIEEHLQYARRYYNGSVRDHNNLVESFPAMLVAWPFGFRQAAFFEIELSSERSVPIVALESV